MNTDTPNAGARPFCVLPRFVPVDVTARAVARFGLSTPPAAPVRGAVRALLLAEVTREKLADALADSDLFYVIETPEGSDPLGAPLGDWLGVPAVERGFFLSLTTGSAFGLQGAVLVCDVLMSRGVLVQDRRSAVELCLHEALANGIVHGNLGIASAAKDHPDGYRVFSQLVNDRLGDDSIRRRRLDVLVRWDDRVVDIAVGDQGCGFDVAILPEEADGNARSGRGFVFMRALAEQVTITDGGRCTSLRFEV